MTYYVLLITVDFMALKAAKYAVNESYETLKLQSVSNSSLNTLPKSSLRVGGSLATGGGGAGPTPIRQNELTNERKKQKE